MKKVIYICSFSVLAISASAQVVSSAKLYVSEGAVVSMGQDFQNKGELINKGEIRLRQDLQNDGDIRSEGEMVFDGYNQQEIRGSKNVVLSAATLENNVKLSTPLLIDETMNFNQGVLSSDDNSPLVFSAKATHFGASDYSHAVGTVTKVESDRFEFPVGDGANYRGFEANNQNRSTLTASYKAQDATKISADLASGVDHVNASEYWVLKSDDATEVTNIRLHNTYEDNVAYLKKGTWTMAENSTLDGKSGLNKGVAFTSGRGTYIKKDIGVWPNPTQGDFNLKLTGMNDSDDVHIDVTNQDGRVVLDMKGKVSELRKVYALPASLVTTELTVRVINGEEVMTEKLILNR